MKNIIYKVFSYRIFCISFAILVLGVVMLMIENIFSVSLFSNIVIIIAILHVSINFFLRAFEPISVEYNWPIVFPELLTGEDCATNIYQENKEMELLKSEIAELKDKLINEYRNSKKQTF